MGHNRDIAIALGYKNTKDALTNHVDEKYKIQYRNIKGVAIHDPLVNAQPHTIFIMEPGLYSLIFSSKLDSAKDFRDWVFSTVLLSIRKYGYYKKIDTPNKFIFKIENEYDLHSRVVQNIIKFYPKALM